MNPRIARAWLPYKLHVWPLDTTVCVTTKVELGNDKMVDVKWPPLIKLNDHYVSLSPFTSRETSDIFLDVWRNRTLRSRKICPISAKVYTVSDSVVMAIHECMRLEVPDNA